MLEAMRIKLKVDTRLSCKKFLTTGTQGKYFHKEDLNLLYYTRLIKAILIQV